MVNGFNSLLNIILPLDIPMINVRKRTEEIAQENYRSIPLAEQIGQKYLEIAGACREILNVPIAKQLQTQTDRLTQLAFSLGVTKITYRGYITETKGASKAVETAAEKIKKFTDALKQSEVAAKSLTRSQKATADAKKQLGNRDKDLATAQEEFNQAVKGYGKDSAQASDAQKALSRAQRNVEEAGYRVEDAIFAVGDAEKALAEVRKDPKSDPRMIREAEIKLAQAKLQVVDALDAEDEATKSRTDSQIKLNEVVNGAIVGSVIYDALLDEVTRAKEAQENAANSLAEAIQRETDAYNDLAEAIRKAAGAAKASGQTFTGPTLPLLPTVPQPGGSSAPPTGQGGGGTTIVVNTGVGTNGIEAGRQIVQLLQQYTAVDAFAIDKLGFAPRR
jgi:DNA repair exonuclease SbcCD ATPase subunit